MKTIREFILDLSSHIHVVVTDESDAIIFEGIVRNLCANLTLCATLVKGRPCFNGSTFIITI
ncbi:MAG: hypothetical protein IH571_06930 [Acholeplasmataceae bacterium]|nr:hypothetical protein [Acholeplasmataceae bacterium]